MGLKKNNAAGLSYGASNATNEPVEYGDRQRAYLEERSKLFYDKRAHLATDYVNARVQGLTSDFEAWTDCKIRLSDLIPEVITTVKKMDDYKMMLIPSRKIGYLPLGAKVETMGSTYIAANVSNISSVACTAILARCNAVYCTYDEYGNVLKEPIHIERYDMTGNDDKDPYNMVLLNGNFRVTCQANEITRSLHDDSRLIIGKNAFQITGAMDFVEEFTGEFDSTHYMTFTCRIVEPVENDDMVNRVANGLATSFGAEIIGADSVAVGASTAYTAHFLVNGEEKIDMFFYFSSDNPDVLRIGTNGSAEAVSDGVAKITAELAENPNVTAVKTVTVSSSLTPYIQFDDVVPTVCRQYETVNVFAMYVDANGQLDSNVTFAFSGANENDFTAVSLPGRCEITCNSPSDVPLTVTAMYGSVSASIQIELEGY